MVNGTEVVTVIDDKIFVGAENSLQVFDAVEDLEQSKVVNLSSDNATVRVCSDLDNGLGIDPSDCKNFIRTIQPFPSGDEVLVCGTNAYHPQCTIHDLNNPSDYYSLTSATDPGYSPFSQTHPFVAIWASNGRFFSATRFDQFLTRTSIRMSPGALQNDTSFTAGTRQDDPRWLNTPTFVSVHEHGEHVYFFMTEPAVELDAVQEVRYSRVIRICKTDTGISSGGTDPASNYFLTFEKARLECSVEGATGSIPFYYNNLASTFLDQSDSENPTLYGVFNSPTNGPAGGAICRFSFDDSQSGSITEVFNDVNYLVQEMTNGQTTWVRNVADSFSCPGSSGNQRETADAEAFQLKYNSVTPSINRPLFISPSEFLDKIAAETIEYMGDVQEIIYFTNQQGIIMQTVLSTQNSAEEYVHMILTPDTVNPVSNLILRNPSAYERSLIASFSDRIIQIPRGQCSRYTDCFTCFDSRDAYCGWDASTMRCVNKLEHTNLASLAQSFSASEEDIITACGSRQSTSTPTAAPISPCSSSTASSGSSGSIEITTNTREEDCSTPGPVATDSLFGGNGSTSLNIGIIIGATAAAFFIGIVIGCGVCLLFSKFCMRSKRGKKSAPETPINTTASTIDTLPNNSHTTNNNTTHIEMEAVDSEKVDISITSLKPSPPPRYTLHKPAALSHPNGVVSHVPESSASFDHLAPSSATLGSPTSLPSQYIMNTDSNCNASLPHLPEETSEEDSAFADKDTLPPLRTFRSTGTMYGSLGRNRAPNGVSRKQVPGHKLPRGRTDSTTWLCRQRSESLSSDISSANTSPLQSPISDV